MAEVIPDATPGNVEVVVVCIEAGYGTIRVTDSTMEDVEMALIEQTWDLAGHRLHIGMRLRVVAAEIVTLPFDDEGRPVRIKSYGMTAPLGVYAWRKEVFEPFAGIGGLHRPPQKLGSRLGHG